MVREHHHIRLVRLILSLAIALHALGLFIVFFRGHHTNFGNYLFMVLEIDHAKAMLIEKVTVTLLLSLSIINIFYTRASLLLLISIYIFIEAWTGYVQGGYHFSELTLGTHALRYLAPLALMALVLPRQLLLNNNSAKLTEWVLRIGLALVFLTHGLECLWGNPRFIDLIIGGVNNVVGFRFTEATALQLMQVIGWVDLIVALGVLIKPLKPLLGWLFFWAFITALSRVASLGAGAYTEVLLRASHILAPIALWLLHYQPPWMDKFTKK